MTSQLLYLALSIVIATIAIVPITLLIRSIGLFPLNSDRPFSPYRQRTYEDGLPTDYSTRRVSSPTIEIAEHPHPGVRYSAHSIVNYSRDRWAFSKLEVLSNPTLLFETASALTTHLAPQDQWICALGSSGLPLGVATAIIAAKPLFFSKRTGFPHPGTSRPFVGPRVLPTPQPGTEGAFVDSHTHTGHSSADAYRHFSDVIHAKPTKLLTPISFDTYPLAPPDSMPPRVPLCRLSQCIDDILYLKAGLPRATLLDLISDPGGEFWRYPPFEAKAKPYALFGSPGLVKRPGWFIGKGSDFTSITSLAPSLRDRYHGVIASDDGVWAAISQPSFLDEAGQLAASRIDLAAYDLIVGIGYLGTAFAVTVAYHGRNVYTGQLASYMGMQGLIPVPHDIRGKRILAIQAHLQTGVYAVDVFHRLRELDADLQTILTVFPPHSAPSWFLRSYQSSIDKLESIGVSIVSLL